MIKVTLQDIQNIAAKITNDNVKYLGRSVDNDTFQLTTPIKFVFVSRFSGKMYLIQEGHILKVMKETSI